MKRVVLYSAGVLVAVISVVMVLHVHAQKASPAPPSQAEPTPIVAVGPDAGVVRWLQPDSATVLGDGALLNIKIDRLSVPYTTMMVATQKLAASGIPVHNHTWEDEVLYILEFSKINFTKSMHLA